MRRLAAFCKWANKIDDLDPCFQDLCRCVLLHERRRRPMDWITLGVVHRAAVINRIASDVKKPSEHALAYWHGDWTASVSHAHAALKSFCPRHRDRAHPIFARCCCTSSVNFVGLPLTSYSISRAL